MNNNKILFATDFSKDDSRAFQQSCRLALEWNAKLDIVYVREPGMARKIFDTEHEFARYLPEDLAINFDQIVLKGDAADSIIEFAEKQESSLIVLGTHGRTGLDRVFGGSVAEAVLRKSTCPVMTTPNDKDAPNSHAIKRILVPIDFSVYGYAAIDFASRVAAVSNADLTICYVDDADRTATSEHQHGHSKFTEHQATLWKELCQYEPTISKVDAAHKLLTGLPGKEICDYANSKNFDYIVVGTHGRTGVGRTLMGSVAEYVVRNANCPVIAVKPDAKFKGLFSSRASASA